MPAAPSDSPAAAVGWADQGHCCQHRHIRPWGPTLPLQPLELLPPLLLLPDIWTALCEEARWARQRCACNCNCPCR